MKQIEVEISGIADLMMDAFRGQKDVPTEEKLYLQDGKVVVPAGNLQSFLSIAGDRAARYNRTGKPWTELGPVANSCIIITPAAIPVLREDEPIVFKKFGENGIGVDRRKTGGGEGGGNKKIPPEMKDRPVISTPWSLKFTIRLMDNELLNEDELKYWFEVGGIYSGLCNGRKIGFGKFEVTAWKIVK